MKNDFQDFKKHFKYYQEKFGLNGYKIYFKNESLDGTFASIFAVPKDAVATVKFNKSLSKEERPFACAQRSAKHEAIHLLLARFSDLAESRCVSRDELSAAEEELTTKLGGLIK